MAASCSSYIQYDQTQCVPMSLSPGHRTRIKLYSISRTLNLSNLYIICETFWLEVYVEVLSISTKTTNWMAAGTPSHTKKERSGIMYQHPRNNTRFAGYALPLYHQFIDVARLLQMKTNSVTWWYSSEACPAKAVLWAIIRSFTVWVAIVWESFFTFIGGSEHPLQ